MQNEIESKFYPVVKDDLRSKLASIGAICIHPERLMKRMIFDHRHNPILEKKNIRYIRVRDEGDSITMSAKDYPRPDEGQEWQQETCVKVSSFDDAVAILKATGLIQNAYQETKRETWKLGESLIEIDEWPGLKPYVEIETVDGKTLQSVAGQLGLNWEMRLNDAVVEIYMSVYGLDRKEVLSLISHATFESNPFASLKPVS
ncbi:MAG: CYTH domain-containing protein [Candidatus Roizmanbacteria bacterium]